MKVNISLLRSYIVALNVDFKEHECNTAKKEIRFALIPCAHTEKFKGSTLHPSRNMKIFNVFVYFVSLGLSQRLEKLKASWNFAHAVSCEKFPYQDGISHMCEILPQWGISHKMYFIYELFENGVQNICKWCENQKIVCEVY